MTEIRMTDQDGYRLTLAPYRDTPDGRHDVIMTMADRSGGNVTAFRLTTHTAGVLIASIRTAMIAATALDFAPDGER